MSKPNTGRPNGRPPVWDAAKVIAAIQRTSRAMGRTPSIRELHQHGGPSLTVLEKWFGNYGKACKAAGVKPNRPGGKVKHGRFVASGYVILPKIDWRKAAAITADKRAWWEQQSRRSA